jgi:protein arginine N-methyltransferase 5
MTNSHNTRSAALTFHIPHAASCHGLAGYFEAHLYGNIGISIHPDKAHNVSPDMFSWFPLFFPFKQPLYLPSGSEMDVNIWRLWDGAKNRIWYEWAAEAYLPVSSAPALPSAASNGGLNTPQSMGRASLQTPKSAGGTSIASPMMDAPYSPGFPNGAQGSSIMGALGEIGRVKIGQTSLHNPGGIHSWVGL